MEFYFERINAQEVADFTLPVNRGFLFGDGFFTTGIIQSGEILDLELHLARITSSAKILRFPELNLDNLKARLKLHATKEHSAGFRLTVSRTQPQRGYAISEAQKTLCFLQFFNRPVSSERYAEIFFAQTPISINPLTAGIKHLNRLDNVLAASEIRHANQEAVMCNHQEVICGSRSNIFVMQKGKWATPCIDKAGIKGIIRRKVMTYFAKHGIDCQEKTITQKELIDSEAAFLTNSLINIWPVNAICQNQLSTDASEEVRIGFTQEYGIEN